MKNRLSIGHSLVCYREPSSPKFKQTAYSSTKRLHSQQPTIHQCAKQSPLPVPSLYDACACVCFMYAHNTVYYMAGMWSWFYIETSLFIVQLERFSVGRFGGDGKEAIKMNLIYFSFRSHDIRHNIGLSIEIDSAHNGGWDQLVNTPDKIED